jgi:hypothetical protein
VGYANSRSRLWRQGTSLRAPSSSQRGRHARCFARSGGGVGKRKRSGIRPPQTCAIRMPVILARERDDTCVMTLRGSLRKDDVDRIQQPLIDFFAENAMADAHQWSSTGH